jgi:hypothetical protein
VPREHVEAHPSRVGPAAHLMIKLRERKKRKKKKKKKKKKEKKERENHLSKSASRIKLSSTPSRTSHAAPSSKLQIELVRPEHLKKIPKIYFRFVGLGFIINSVYYE